MYNVFQRRQVTLTIACFVAEYKKKEHLKTHRERKHEGKQRKDRPKKGMRCLTPEPEDPPQRSIPPGVTPTEAIKGHVTPVTSIVMLDNTHHNIQSLHVPVDTDRPPDLGVHTVNQSQDSYYQQSVHDLYLNYNSSNVSMNIEQQPRQLCVPVDRTDAQPKHSVSNFNSALSLGAYISQDPKHIPKTSVVSLTTELNITDLQNINKDAVLDQPGKTIFEEDTQIKTETDEVTKSNNASFKTNTNTKNKFRLTNGEQLDDVSEQCLSAEQCINDSFMLGLDSNIKTENKDLSKETKGGDFGEENKMQSIHKKSMRRRKIKSNKTVIKRNDASEADSGDKGAAVRRRRGRLKATTNKYNKLPLEENSDGNLIDSQSAIKKKVMNEFGKC